MANKLYEENDVWRIANSIRRNAPRLVGERTMLLSEMPSGIDDVYMEGYENGWSSITDNPNESDSITTEVDETSVKVTVAEGYYESNIVKVLTVENGDLDAILDYFVDENTRDATNIHSDISVENQNVRVTVESGYYTEDTIVDIDVSDVAGSGGGGSLDDNIRIFAPIFIQNEATKITATSYDNQQVYYSSDFENAVVGNITYNWQDDITTQVTATVTSITLTAQNNNPLLSVVVCVAVEYRKISGTLVATKHIYVDVPPSSSNTKQITFSKIGVGKIPYSSKVHYLKFSLGGN